MKLLLSDFGYAQRTLRRSPGFALLAVSALALGIGANAAVFSVVNAVLLRPLPFRDPGRLVTIEGIPAVKFTGARDRVLGWEDWVSKTRTLEDISVYEQGGVNLAGDPPEYLPAAAVSGSFFRLLGVGPVRGRTLLPGDDSPGPAVAVISYDLWQGHFAADPAIVGKKVELAGQPFTVMGVMPPGFEFPGDTQLWIPQALNQQQNLFGEAAIMYRQVARLRPGVKVAQARAELEVFLGELNREHAGYSSLGPKLSVTPLRLALVKDTRLALLLLMGAVGLVLLIACADVANLVLVRNAGRAREMAVRAALGAGRSRLVSQLLAESVLLSLAGGAAGLGIGAAGARLAEGLMPTRLILAGKSMTGAIQLDARVLGFTFAVALLTGIFAGLFPAIGSSKVNLSETLKAGGASSWGTLGAIRQHRVRALLAVSEIALALILLVGASLLIRSLAALSQVNPGFRYGRLLTARLFLSAPGYRTGKARARFYERVAEQARALPGVSDAAFINSLPLGEGVSAMFSLGLEGTATPKPETSNLWAIYLTVSPDYFRAMGIPLVEGRAFDKRDREGAPGVVIVSQTMARRFWPNQDPLGKRVTMMDPPKWLTVVGVVGDVRHWGLTDEMAPAMYPPILQQAPASAFLVLRLSGPVTATDVARAVRAVDTAEPVTSVHTGEELMARQTSAPRFRAVLLGIFSALALVLAVLGVYGIMSYSVSQRTQEIGVRMALGAQPEAILRLVLRQAAVLTLAGVAAGIVGSLMLGRLLASMVYSVRPGDPWTLAACSVILAGIALAASYLPARRASRVDPMVALRQE
jgi:putative ABC transport system permease protein